MDFDAEQDDGEPIFPHSKHSDVITLNWKIMMGSAFFMCLIMLIVLILHIYSRVATRNRARTRDDESSTNPPKPGLDPSVLASLPVLIVKDQVDQSDKINTECPVCLSLFEVGKFARVLPNCKHIFHVECIDQWLSSHSTCPICRAAVI